MVKRVALFCSESNGLIHHIVGLANAFRSLGIKVYSGYAFLNGDRFAAFMDLVRPDFVFEINRARAQIDYLEDFYHIAWIQDHGTHEKRIVDGFHGSNMNYCLFPPEILGYREDVIGRWDILHMGVDPYLYTPAPGHEPQWDISTIAYLAAPVSDNDMLGRIASKGVETTLGELLEGFNRIGMTQSSLNVTVIERFLLDFMRARRPDYVPDEIFSKLMVFLEDRFLRSMDRAELLEKLLKVTQNIAVFGNGYWIHHPLLSQYYKGLVRIPSDKVRIHNNSKIVFHNGVLGMHERVFEAMACERPVICSRTPGDNLPYGLNAHFEPGVDFAPYDTGDVASVAAGLLADPEKRRLMGESGRSRVLSGHTWLHRAKQILKDFEER